MLVPYLPATTPSLPRGYYSAGQRLLRSWDFQQPADSAAAAYYNVVWSDLLAATFHDELPQDQWPDGGDRWMAVVTRLLRHPDDPWWNDVSTPERETRDTILRRVMIEARDDLTRLESRSPHGWSWGQIHELDLHNQTLGESGIGPVEQLLNRGGWGGAGRGTRWSTRGRLGRRQRRLPELRFVVTSAPSMRMVVDLADPRRLPGGVNLTGESGHAFDSHYTDQTDLWAPRRRPSLALFAT